jgi:hypothetical protein
VELDVIWEFVGICLLCRSISESSLETSIEGKYRNVNENDSQTSIPDAVEPVEEPKKERERFRDKMKVKFKLKSNKTASPTPEHVEISDEDFFGSNLETVEKDTEFKFVPKIVTETVHILEETANLSTPGIYRVSGRRTSREVVELADDKIDLCRKQNCHRSSQEKSQRQKVVKEGIQKYSVEKPGRAHTCWLVES